MNRIKLIPHLTLEELEAGYRQATEAIERTHYQIIGWLTQGKSTAEVAKLSGYSVVWVRQVAGRYNRAGAAGLGDQRHHNPGQKRLLNGEQESQLKAEVEAAEVQGEAWSGVQVAQRMSELLGQPVHAVRGWEMLKRWEYRLKTPRPRHVKADEPSQTAFKKSS
jgi:transposase